MYIIRLKKYIFYKKKDLKLYLDLKLYIYMFKEI